MSDAEIDALRKEVAQLRQQLDELQECCFKHFEMFTKHGVSQYQDISDLFSYIMPILKRVYPGYAPTKRQMDAVIHRKAAPPHLKDLKKKRP